MNIPARFSQTKALIFDYGNTLIEFGPRQMEIQAAELQRTLEELLGTCDAVRLREIRARQVVAPYTREFRENDMREVSAELIRELYHREPAEAEVLELVSCRSRSFVRSITAPEGVADFLRELRRSFRIALLSNYPCGDSIRESLRLTGLAEHFDAVVVSGDLGWVKPHPEPFRAVLDGLGVAAADCVFVGDNWLADIQGAKRAGMMAVHITQHTPYERFDPQPGDHQPDARIQHLFDLRALLAG